MDGGAGFAPGFRRRLGGLGGVDDSFDDAYLDHGEESGVSGDLAGSSGLLGGSSDHCWRVERLGWVG